MWLIIMGGFALGIMRAGGDFVGFPLEGNTNAPTWYEAREMYNPIGQLYSAIVERCEFTGVAEPEIVESWTCSAGTSNEIVTIEGVTYTNIHLLSKSVTTTNQLGPFVYSYSDPSGAHTATGLPFVTRGFLNALDTKLDTLIPYFVDMTWTNAGGTFTNWFLTPSAPTNYPTSFPIACKASLFERLDIGFRTNLMYGSWKNITNGNVWYTRQPTTKRNWLLAECHATDTNEWSFLDIGALDTRFYESSWRPILRYTSGGTNALGSLSVSLSGTKLLFSDQSQVGASENVTLTSSNYVLAEPWYDLSSITCSTAPPNEGDVLAVMWTNAIVLFGDRPYRLYATDLDERIEVLRVLVSTYDLEDEINMYWFTEKHTNDVVYTNTDWDVVASNVRSSFADSGNWQSLSEWSSYQDVGIQVMHRVWTNDYVYHARVYGEGNRAFRGQPYLDDIPTNFAHQGQCYLQIRSIDDDDWNFMNYPTYAPGEEMSGPNRYHYWDTLGEAVTNERYASVYPPTNALVNMFPTNHVYVHLGFSRIMIQHVDRHLWLLNWRGFEYK